VKIFHKNKQGKGLLIESNNQEVRLIINDNYNRSDFELSIDEARALRDSLKKAIRESDEESVRYLNQDRPVYQQRKYPEPAPRTEPSPEMPLESVGSFFNQEPITPEPQETGGEGFRLFNNEEKLKKRGTEFYY